MSVVSDCVPNPTLTQQQSIDNKLGLMLGQGMVCPGTDFDPYTLRRGHLEKMVIVVNGKSPVTKTVNKVKVKCDHRSKFSNLSNCLNWKIYCDDHISLSLC